jgi:hypothetical protein
MPILFYMCAYNDGTLDSRPFGFAQGRLFAGMTV